MFTSNPEATRTMQSELAAGESLVWTGQPNPRVIFHKDDLFLVPFSLFWGGFALFWEGGVSGFWDHGSRNGAWVFGMIWGIPFVLIGQYLIWGRFIYDAWLKRRTYYAVTSRRIIVVQNGWSRKMVAAYLDSLPTVTKEGPDSGPGTQFIPLLGVLGELLFLTRPPRVGSLERNERRRRANFPRYRQPRLHLSSRLRSSRKVQVLQAMISTPSDVAPSL